MQREPNTPYADFETSQKPQNIPNKPPTTTLQRFLSFAFAFASAFFRETLPFPDPVKAQKHTKLSADQSTLHGSSGSSPFEIFEVFDRLLLRDGAALAPLSLPSACLFALSPSAAGPWPDPFVILAFVFFDFALPSSKLMSQ